MTSASKRKSRDVINHVSSLSNPASERAVLAGIARHGIDAYVDVDSLLTENCFTIEHNKVLYQCMKKSMETHDSIDFASVISAAADLRLDAYVDDSIVLKHFQAVFDTPIKIENVREHAAKIRRLDFAREMKTSLMQIAMSLQEVTGEESLAHIQNIAEQPLQELALNYIREDDNTPKLIGTDLTEYIDHVVENPCDIMGLSSGFNSYDNIIGGGLRRKCVDLIAARPGCGKSTIGDNVAMFIAKQGIPTLVLDTEMAIEDHYNRILANIAGVEVNRIATGKFSEDPSEVEKIKEAIKIVEASNYHYISISGRPFEETLSIARRWLLKTVGYTDGRMNDCLIVYDYLKLMTSESISNHMAEFQVLGFQITALHNFCVEYDCPCLAFVQLNRDGIQKETSDTVSGSDRLIWLCSSFSIFKEKTQEEIAKDGVLNGNLKLVPIKTRHGGGMEDGYVCLRMEGKYARLTELGTVREIERGNTIKRDGFETKDTATENDGDGQD